MYTIIFTGKDHKVNSSYIYYTYEEALEHFNKFIDDDSNLYSNISIMNENTRTIQLIGLFDKSGHMYSKIEDQDIVKLRPEWARPEELKDRYVVCNIHEDTERCLIKALDSKSILGSSESVGLEMIQPV